MDLKRWFKLCCINVLLLFSTIDIVLSQRTCVKGMNFPGYTVPSGDIVIEYGKPLDITCVLHNTNKLRPNASRHLTFLRNNETMPSEMIEILNSTAIKLHIDKPPKVSGDSYNCLVDNVSVCMNFVTVGTKPQPVKDFKCIGYNYDNLTCTWTPPENYVTTNYTLTYFLGGRSSRHAYNCPPDKGPKPTNNDKRMRCVWKVSTTPQYRQVHEEFLFTLKMMNKFGEDQMEEKFSHFAHVLSGPPENLTVVSNTPSSIYLYWMVPTSMQFFPPGVHHRILYQCMRSEKKWHFGGEITDKPNSIQMYFNLTNLKHANTLCDIRVSLRSAKALPNDESMWSRNASITVATASKIPDEPPKTNPGSFEIVADGVQYRQVYFYWQQIPEEQRNGPEFNYDFQVDGHPDLRPTENTSSYAKFVNLSFSNSYRFNIWSYNKNGTSLRKSSIVVPKQTDQIKGPRSFTKVEFGGGRYELTWEAPDVTGDQYVTNYTIFWCNDKRDRPHQCKGYLNWTVVPSTERGYNLTVSEEDIFQFAISANSERGSSGMVWAACTIIHNKRMGKMKNVNIRPVDPTSVEATWKLDCSDRIGSVVGFIIYYCPIVSLMQPECKGSQKNKTLYGDDSVKGYNITDLNPYTTYGFSVAVITKHTTYSQQSDPIYTTTLEAASSSPQNLKVANFTNSTISLVWNSPVSPNGILRYYNIVYRNGTEVNEEKLDLNTNSSNNKSINNFTLSNLVSYERYFITVTACTIKCSKESNVVNVTTKAGYPSKINKPTVDRRNDTTITIVWPKPSRPNGRNEYYIVQLKQNHQKENTTLELNVTEQKYVLENCGDGGKYNTFYVAVKAVNVIDNVSYHGPWSDELENYCYTPVNYLAYILSILVIVFFVAMAFLFNRIYKHCKIMRDVEVKLPPGLAPVIAENTLVAWNTEKHQENRDSRSPPDEELLLVKMNEGRHLSGDSSGCSSGHESVTSSLGSGTHISSSSDSGTEQPGNYCVLGVDPKADSSYVPVTADSNKVPYKTCDVSTESSPYVLTGDAVKTVNPGYIPFNQNETIGKSSGYVVAGIKNCNGYIPFNQTETVNRNTGYVVAGIKNCKLD